MTVITISREFGCYGDLLAERVARTLKFHLVDKAFIRDVLAQYGLTEFDEEYESKAGSSGDDAWLMHDHPCVPHTRPL